MRIRTPYRYVILIAITFSFSIYTCKAGYKIKVAGINAEIEKPMGGADWSTTQEEEVTMDEVKEAKLDVVIDADTGEVIDGPP
jgi:hypothetical protein